MADWGTPAEAERQAWPALVGWFVLFAAAGLVVAYLNRHHVEQQSNDTIYISKYSPTQPGVIRSF